MFTSHIYSPISFPSVRLVQAVVSPQGLLFFPFIGALRSSCPELPAKYGVVASLSCYPTSAPFGSGGDVAGGGGWGIFPFGATRHCFGYISK